MRSEKSFLESVKIYIEQSETELDTHLGSHRSLETMIRMNIMPPLYQETLERLQSLQPDIVALLSTFTNDERLSIFRNFCLHCGCTDPSCQCWNDE